MSNPFTDDNCKPHDKHYNPFEENEDTATITKGSKRKSESTRDSYPKKSFKSAEHNSSNTTRNLGTDVSNGEHIASPPMHNLLQHATESNPFEDKPMPVVLLTEERGNPFVDESMPSMLETRKPGKTFVGKSTPQVIKNEEVREPSLEDKSTLKRLDTTTTEMASRESSSVDTNKERSKEEGSKIPTKSKNASSAKDRPDPLAHGNNPFEDDTNYYKIESGSSIEIDGPLLVHVHDGTIEKDNRGMSIVGKRISVHEDVNQENSHHSYNKPTPATVTVNASNVIASGQARIREGLHALIEALPTNPLNFCSDIQATTDGADSDERPKYNVSDSAATETLHGSGLRIWHSHAGKHCRNPLTQHHGRKRGGASTPAKLRTCSLPRRVFRPWTSERQQREDLRSAGICQYGHRDDYVSVPFCRREQYVARTPCHECSTSPYRNSYWPYNPQDLCDHMHLSSNYYRTSGMRDNAVLPAAHCPVHRLTGGGTSTPTTPDDGGDEAPAVQTPYWMGIQSGDPAVPHDSSTCSQCTRAAYDPRLYQQDGGTTVGYYAATQVPVGRQPQLAMIRPIPQERRRSDYARSSYPATTDTIYGAGVAQSRYWPELQNYYYPPVPHDSTTCWECAYARNNPWAYQSDGSPLGYYINQQQLSGQPQQEAMYPIPPARRRSRRKINAKSKFYFCAIALVLCSIVVVGITAVLIVIIELTR